jgi:hypothetical protein
MLQARIPILLSAYIVATISCAQLCHAQSAPTKQIVYTIGTTPLSAMNTDGLVPIQLKRSDLRSRINMQANLGYIFSSASYQYIMHPDNYINANNRRLGGIQTELEVSKSTKNFKRALGLFAQYRYVLCTFDMPANTSGYLLTNNKFSKTRLAIAPTCTYAVPILDTRVTGGVQLALGLSAKQYKQNGTPTAENVGGESDFLDFETDSGIHPYAHVRLAVAYKIFAQK